MGGARRLGACRHRRIDTPAPLILPGALRAYPPPTRGLRPRAPSPSRGEGLACAEEQPTPCRSRLASTSSARATSAGKPVLVWTSLVADLETPVSAMLKLADGRPNSFLFESVEGGAARGRYSIIGMKPDLIWRCVGGRAEINRQARFDPDAFGPAEGNAASPACAR